MRVSLISAVVFLACLTVLADPVSVEVLFEQDQFLANEAMVVGVRIRNYSGRTLKLGADPEWLQFAVETDNHVSVLRLRAPDVAGEFELPNAKQATRKVEIASCFDLTKPGRYHVTAIVRVPDLGIELASQDAPESRVTIVNGSRIWALDFAIPTSGSTPGGLGDPRRYELIQALNRKQLQLYVRVTDLSGARVFRAFSLGTLLTVSTPEKVVDQSARLHVLFQVGAKVFSYHVISPNGEDLVNDRYQYTGSRPSLRTFEDGTVKVHGATRLKDPSELDREEEADAADRAAKVAPTAPAPEAAAPPTPTPTPAAPK